MTRRPSTDALSAAVGSLKAAYEVALTGADLIRHRAEKRHPEWLAAPAPEGDVRLCTEDGEYGAFLDHCGRLTDLVADAEAEFRWLAKFVSGLGGAS